MNKLAEAEVVAYTVPHTVGPKSSSPFEAQMVVGVRAEDGNTLWAPGQNDSSEKLPEYQSGDAEETRIILVPGMPSRLVNFFQNFIMHNKTELGYTRPTYDCHFFAQWMRGRPGPYHDARRLRITERLAQVMIVDGEVASDMNVGLGRLGVLGVRALSESGPVSAKHSIIGLGEESGNCIQVMGTYRPLIISSCADVAEHYRASNALIADDGKVFSGIYGLYLPTIGTDPTPSAS